MGVQHGEEGVEQAKSGQRKIGKVIWEIDKTVEKSWKNHKRKPKLEGE